VAWHSRLSLVAVLAAMLGVTAISQDNSGEAFYAAIRANDLPRLNGILTAGANVNAKDERGITPLMYTAWVGSVDAMKGLLDHAADPNLSNSSGSTALMLSSTEIAKVRLLIDRGAKVNVASTRGRTALFLAAMSDRSVDIARLLTSAGADVKVVDGMKMTVLHAAALGNDTETVRLLIDAGLDVNATDFQGFTPLIYASSNGNLAAARLLLAKGADVNAVSGDGSFQKVKAGTLAQGHFTPLIMAAPFGSAELVKTLLEAGAKVNAQDIRGMTPLMLAVATDHQNQEIIRALMAKGADPNIKSLAGETALDWALKIGATSGIDTLKRAGGVNTLVTPPVLPAVAPVDVRSAAQRSVTLLETTAVGAAANGGCASCHTHNITDLVTNLARSKGLQVDEKAANDRRTLTRGQFFSPLNMLERLDVPGTPDTPLFALGALANAAYKPDRITDGIVANVVAQQSGAGHWLVPHGAIARPPIEDGDISRTARGIGALKTYGAPGRAADFDERIGRARDWLAATRATTAEDRNMQLIGLRWAGADDGVLRRLAKAILAAQRSDGGWSQRAELTSDAYATGQTLYALAVSAAVSPRESAYQRGVQYLLSAQRADGSWYVRSRAPKFQPFFESGFPYGHDQWISQMATGWAAAALTLAIDDRPGVHDDTPRRHH
jgi:ankyrin repeat protein